MSGDALAVWRDEFPTLERCTYLVSHSLGAMPRRTAANLQEYAETWSRRGVRAWHEGWWEIGRTTGDLLAPILGVPAGTVSMHQNVTVAMGIIASCFRYDGARRKIVLSDLEFPTNMYLFEGFARYGAEIVYVPSDGAIRNDLGRLLDAIDELTVLVPLSLVLFRSSCIQDAAAVIAKAHQVGAHVILDVYQAAGTVPLHIDALGASFAVGGSVKWLCGGPGAGYLYVRPDLARTLEPGLIGWAAHAEPFSFAIGPVVYADGPERFQSGTPNVPALYAARAGYEIVAEIGVAAIREKSLRLTRRIIDHATRAGYTINTPVDDSERGGAVILDVAHGEAVSKDLLRRNIIIDYRPEAGIRISPHFYNNEDDVDAAMKVLDDVVAVGARLGMVIRRVAVLGAGTMGHGIAHAAASAGNDTAMFDVSQEALDKARLAFAEVVRGGVERGKITAAEADATLRRLSTTSDGARALAEADFVIEAAPERLDIKIQVFADIERLAPAHAVVASNTSALSVTELAATLTSPSRVAGMHFFNPVHKMKLIEVVQALETAPATLEAVQELAARMGKETVLVRESPGFITTRVNASIGNEAFYMLMEGVASARDIDKALKLGLNHPMGPFELVDLVGLDTRLSILEYLHRSMGEKYRPCPLLVQYVKAGRLGRKVGRGVYDY